MQFDDRLAVGQPDQKVTAGRRARRDRIAVDAVKLGPLPGQSFTGLGPNDRVVLAVPDGHRRPLSAMRYRGSNRIARDRRRPGLGLTHGSEGFRQCLGRAVGQAGDHRASGEKLRPGGQHDGGHGTARREAGDENAPHVQVMIRDRALDHGGDGGGLAAVAGRVAWLVPIEAEVEIVGPRLFGA